jgi:hypothetical protein
VDEVRIRVHNVNIMIFMVGQYVGQKWAMCMWSLDPCVCMCRMKKKAQMPTLKNNPATTASGKLKKTPSKFPSLQNKIKSSPRVEVHEVTTDHSLPHIESPRSGEKPHECQLFHPSVVVDVQIAALVQDSLLNDAGGIHEDITQSCHVSESMRDIQNGAVVIAYEMYKEEFPIIRGCLDEALIHDVYGLCDVMPNCALHLSLLNPSDMRQKMISDPNNLSNYYLQEGSRGAFHGLEVGQTYYCYVEQDPDRIKWEENLRKQKHSAEEESMREVIVRDDGRGFDSCTCIYGTPCTVSRLQIHQHTAFSYLLFLYMIG